MLMLLGMTRSSIKRGGRFGGTFAVTGRIEYDSSEEEKREVLRGV